MQIASNDDAFLAGRGASAKAQRAFDASTQILTFPPIAAYKLKGLVFGKLVQLQYGPRHCKRGEPEQHATEA